MQKNMLGEIKNDPVSSDILLFQSTHVILDKVHC